MFLKKNRVDRKTIDQIFKKGHFLHSDNITFKFIHNNTNSPRISFISPKGIAKSAVKRNLLRRRGYAVLKKYFDLLPKDISGVFIFSKKSLELFGGKKNKLSDPILNLNNEIKKITNKIN